MLKFIADQYMWLLVFILIVNMLQRKIPHTEKKRFATIYLATLLLIFNILIIVILERDLSHYLGFAALGITLIIGFILRKRAWPFKLHCSKCGAKLNFNQIIGGDENLCSDCYDVRYPKEAEERAKKEEELKKIEEPEFVCPDTVEELDWDSWEAEERCVLTFIRKNNQILLINKKKGLGTGLINGPGGHIELEETAMEAAKREFTEETGLTCGELTFSGTLHFQFKDGTSIIGHIFVGDEAEGELKESEETTPFWCDEDKIPYDKMWEDDKWWLPNVLEGETVSGYFIVDKTKILSKKVTFNED